METSMRKWYLSCYLAAELVKSKDELGLRMMAESDMFRRMSEEHQESVLTLLLAEQARVRTVVLAGLGWAMVH